MEFYVFVYRAKEEKNWDLLFFFHNEYEFDFMMPIDSGPINNSKFLSPFAC